MPNWCTNTLTITGPAETLKQMRDSLAVTPENGRPGSALYLANLTTPWGTPEEEAAYADNWYDLNIAYWGTKWDVEAQLEEDASDDGTLVYSFSSAWSPPVAAIAAASAKWPDVTFTIDYDESGNDFAGRHTYRNSEVLEQREGESRTFYCETCDELTYCDWDEPLECSYAVSLEDAKTAPTGYPTVLHALGAHETLPHDVLAEHLENYVRGVEEGTLSINSYIHEAINAAVEPLSLDARVALAAYSTAPDRSIPTWYARTLVFGLSDDDLDSLAQHPHDGVREIVRLGTVAFALDPEYSQR